ncbi:SNF1-related protein kinase catalytic subunit alpha KIN11 [Platanthera guangdongensis]|uniref:SNF1-related protein kinase catalytic subunit alpha KIN11 n=1 Tax=Platanthera guangdongensis TaxID=2320717 RepID=A0ABR2M7K6_9ASPA
MRSPGEKCVLGRNKRRSGGKTLARAEKRAFEWKMPSMAEKRMHGRNNGCPGRKCVSGRKLGIQEKIVCSGGKMSARVEKYLPGRRMRPHAEKHAPGGNSRLGEKCAPGQKICAQQAVFLADFAKLEVELVATSESSVFIMFSETGVKPSSQGNTTAELILVNYKLGKTFGICSFGKVKIAEHALTGYKAAIKYPASLDVEQFTNNSQRITAGCCLCDLKVVIAHETSLCLLRQYPASLGVEQFANNSQRITAGRCLCDLKSLPPSCS